MRVSRVNWAHPQMSGHKRLAGIRADRLRHNTHTPVATPSLACHRSPYHPRMSRDKNSYTRGLVASALGLVVSFVAWWGVVSCGGAGNGQATLAVERISNSEETSESQWSLDTLLRWPGDGGARPLGTIPNALPALPLTIEECVPLPSQLPNSTWYAQAIWQCGSTIVLKFVARSQDNSPFTPRVVQSGVTLILGVGPGPDDAPGVLELRLVSRLHDGPSPSFWSRTLAVPGTARTLTEILCDVDHDGRVEERYTWMFASRPSTSTVETTVERDFDRDGVVDVILAFHEGDPDRPSPCDGEWVPMRYGRSSPSREGSGR